MSSNFCSLSHHFFFTQPQSLYGYRDAEKERERERERETRRRLLCNWLCKLVRPTGGLGLTPSASQWTKAASCTNMDTLLREDPFLHWQRRKENKGRNKKKMASFCPNIWLHPSPILDHCTVYFLARADDILLELPWGKSRRPIGTFWGEGEEPSDRLTSHTIRPPSSPLHIVHVLLTYASSYRSERKLPHRGIKRMIDAMIATPAILLFPHVENVWNLKFILNLIILCVRRGRVFVKLVK